MATTQAPLMSMDASGTIGKSLVYSHWRGRKYVRQWVMPSNPKSPLQTGMRAAMSFLTTYWAALSSPLKAAWTALGTGDNITGLNAYVRDGQTRTRQNLGVRKDPDAAPGAAEAAPAAFQIEGAPQALTFGWTDSTGANDFATAIFLSKTTGFDPDVSNLVAIIPKGVMTYTKTGLVTGTDYFSRVRGIEKGGQFGASSAEESGTPT